VRVRVYISFIALIGSGLVSESLHARSYQVCSITINSDNEIKTFKKHLEKDPRFSFKELGSKSDEDRSSWFKNACADNTNHCDVLIISGHFGGSFTGDKGFSLSMPELLEASCSENCTGIFKNLVDVYLFGCNTYAGKGGDARSPETYYRDMVNHGIDANTANRQLESMFGVSNTSKDQMSLVFSGARLTGFEGSAPSGKTCEPILNNFLTGFKGPKDYANYLDTLRVSKDTQTKPEELPMDLLPPMNAHNNVSCRAEDLSQASIQSTRAERCYYYDKRIPAKEKLAKLAVKEFKFEGIGGYAQIIQTLLKEDASPEILASLAKNESLNRQLHAGFKQSQTLTTTGDILRLLNRLDPKGAKERDDVFLKMVLKKFKTPITNLDADEICSLDAEMLSDLSLKLTLKDILAKNFRTRDGLRSLGCIKPKDSNIHLSIAESLKDQDKWVRRDAAWIIGEVKSTVLKVHLALVESLKDPDPGVRSGAARAMWDIKPTDPTIHLALVDALKDPDPYVRYRVAQALAHIAPSEPTIPLTLVQSLKDPDPRVRSEIAEALGMIKPKDPIVHLAIVESLKDSDALVRADAAWSLGEIESLDPRILSGLVESLKDTKVRVREEAAKALGKLRPTDPKIHLALVAALNDLEVLVSSDAVWALNYIKPTDLKVHLALVELLKNSNSDVRSRAFIVLGKIKPTDPDVLAAIKGISKTHPSDELSGLMKELNIK